MLVAMAMLILTLFSAVAALTGTSLPPDLPAPGCHDAFRQGWDPGPQSAGPLRLAQVSCVSLDSGQLGFTDVGLSPDGRRAAHWLGGNDGTINFAGLDGSPEIVVPNRASSVFRNYGGVVGEGGGTAPDAIAWRTDSSGLWAARQEVVMPNGWALSGLRPISVALDGTVRVLPALEHRAGPLDALLWVGGDGLALAQFGTKGRYYRPEHADAEPTLAMADARRGRVLDAFPAARIPELRERLRQYDLMAAGAAATILPDGRMRAVIQFGPWADRSAGPGAEAVMRPGLRVLWTQGEPPIQWPAPAGRDRPQPLAFAPGGSTLLIVHQLQPNGVQISCRVRPCPQPPPPTPVTGPLVELVSLPDRRTLWRLDARAGQFWPQHSAPAIGEDGRFALIALPPDPDGRAPVALVDMRNGRIVQRIAPFHTYSYRQSFGFTDHGRRVWVMSGNIVQLYNFRPAAGPHPA